MSADGCDPRVSDLAGDWVDSLVQVVIPAGTSVTLAQADSSRYSILLAVVGTGSTAVIFPGSGAAAAVGFQLSTGTGPIGFNVRDYPTLPQKQWTGFSTVGTTVMVYTSRQQR